MTNPIATLVEAIKNPTPDHGEWRNGVCIAAPKALPALEAVMAQGWQDINKLPEKLLNQDVLALWDDGEREQMLGHVAVDYAIPKTPGGGVVVKYSTLPEPPRSE